MCEGAFGRRIISRKEAAIVEDRRRSVWPLILILAYVDGVTWVRLTLATVAHPTKGWISRIGGWFRFTRWC